MMKKIDTHTHYLPPAYCAMLNKRNITVLDGGMPVPEWTPELHLQNMDALRVSLACLSVSSPHLHMGDADEAAETARACNEYGSSLMSTYPGKFRIMASLPLPEIEASVQEIRYCRDTLGIHTFSLMTNSGGVYLGDPRLDPVMEELNRTEAVVSIHPTEPSSVPDGCCEMLPYPLMEFFFDTTRTIVNMLFHRIFRKYPDIRFIVPHAGAFLAVLSDRLFGIPQVFPDLAGIDVEKSLAGLYYDLAGVSMPKQFDDLKKIVPADHLLYGSDGTFTPLPLCRKLADDMDHKLTETEKELIYQKNAGKLLDSEYSD